MQIDQDHLCYQEQFLQILKNSNNTNFYQFDQNLNEWRMLKLEVESLSQKNQIKLQSFSSNEVEAEKKITAVTLNVLFDYRNNKNIDEDRGHMKFSKDRYQYIFNQLKEMTPHIISLNQVTKEFVRLLQEEQWVKKQYFLSIVHNSKNFNFCFGNILLTKLRPFALNIYKVPQLPRPIMIGFFIINSKKCKKIISFSSIHLIAYDNKWQIRKTQLKNISKYLQKFKGVVNQHILMGDMNFHSQKENQTFLQNNLKDFWLQLYQLQKNPGYTFDAQRNSFIKQLYWGFEKRRMRLDRIFSTNYQKPTIVPVQMKVCFNEPIFKHNVQNGFMFIGKSALSYLGDKFNKNLFRKKQDYLFASDHFGLQATLLINQ